MKTRMMALLVLTTWAMLPTVGESVEALKLDKPLIAHWTFDETMGDVCRDASGNGCDATAERGAAGFERVAGVFDGGLKFSGRHLLRCGEKPAFGKLAKMSFSVWVQPAAFDRYNEIFRKEDGGQRVLFSFQEDGHVLSLGLNINGYTECDAKIEPAQVADGLWHHAAATFDGETMRVYLDGAQIGAFGRPGAVSAGGSASGSIGSSNGGECLRGQMDELRIYADALTGDEVRRLYRNGVEALARSSGTAQALVKAVYARGKSFAETLAGTRRNVAEKGVRLDAKVTAVLLQRLRADYPEECQQFQLWTLANPGSYFRSKGNEFHVEVTARLVEMLTEYKPLTDAQRKKQTADDQKKWDEAAVIEKKFTALKARGDAAQFSPEWIELMFEAGRHIVWRPQVQEAVAPYVTPQTPETRNLTAAEAREMLERDWLFQADGKPTAERIQDEIKWTRELAARTGADVPKELAELEKAEPSTATYFRVREIKRRVMFKNPVLDFDKMLFVDMPFPSGKEWQHETRHRLGYMAVPGARLLVLSGLAPDGKLAQLMPQLPLHGSFWRPDVSFDGKRIVFCFKPHNEKSFHLYEINADGTGLRQITDGEFDDLDPIYTPDGHIVFSTTRGHSYVRCMPPTNAFVLTRCDRDGGNMYFISSNNEPDYLPSVMNDGRVVYTRWEYTDKPLWRAQKLWTVNPDGTQVQMFWGNQSVWPDVVKDARAIPGSRRVMMTGSAHHNWFAGSVGIIDPDKGFNFPHGLAKVTADVTWPECGNGPVDPAESPRYHRSGNFTAYYSPYPLSERDFIVSAKRGEKFALYLMDTDGNRELIYEGTHNIFHAMPLKARPLPPVIADRVAWPSKNDRQQPEHGVIFSNNVYQGAPAGLQGKAKFLRVIHIEPKTYTYWHKRPYLSTGPVVSAVQSEGVKRVLGTVPIEPDGSVAFQAPAGLSLHFQLLDERQRALQTMRSFANVMPGEYRGCLGCHESHSKAPAGDAHSLALAKHPRAITPPPWTDTTVSYTRYVRPVLDKYCARCHEGNGEARKTLDFTFRPGFLDWDETYFTLIGKPTWGKAYELPKVSPPGFGIADTILVEGYEKVDPAAYRTPKPMARLSYSSRLIEKVSGGKHHGVRVDDISLQRLICWVDTMCPYRGDEEVRAEDDPVFQGVEWLAIRPKIKTAPRIPRPGPVE
ncbi:MAG: PD40 domain-containing protein [Verrucomicrobia bacterium]|nr:PD40 domain-containing protein [Verrucomicrobiota bacterium]